MAAARVLYVGEDICHRIPVMESSGIVVLRSPCSVVEVRRSLGKSDDFSAVTFHNDVFSPVPAVVSTARETCTAPLILFRNPSVDCDERPFDLVIPVPTPPEIWSKSLRQTIEDARRLHDYSRRLRQECTDVRDRSRSLREQSLRNRVSPIDYDALFRGEDPGDGNDGSGKPRK